MAGVFSFTPDPIYTATKHAVVGLVRSLAPSLAERGISCHAILPGIVATNLLAEDFTEQALAAGIPVMPPERIADAVVHAVRFDGTGKLWVCLAGRNPYRYEFAKLEGFGPA